MLYYYDIKIGKDPMKLKTIIFIIVFLSVITLAVHFSVVPDTFWHLRTGEIIIRNKEIMSTDTFTFHSEDEEWLYPSLNWLSEVQLFTVYDLFGFAGLNILVALIATISMGFIYYSMSGSPLLRGFVLILATITARIYWGARPHIYGFLFTSIFIWVLENYRRKNINRFWLLPIIMILWVNSHAGFFIGLALVLIYMIGNVFETIINNFSHKRESFWNELKTLPKRLITKKVKDYSLIILILLVSINLNPIGINAFAFPGKTLSMTVLKNLISEWQSPDFHEIGFQPFLWMILALIISMVISSKKLKLSELLLLTSFGFMGFLASRNIYLFALICAPIITHLLLPVEENLTKNISDYGSENHSSNKFFSAIKLILILLVVVAVVLQITPYLNEQNNINFVSEHNPVSASKQLAVFSSNYRILNSYNHGGFLLWALPSQKVFIDGRTDLYGDDFIYDWVKMVNLELGWKEIFVKWNFNIVMLEPKYPLTELLKYEGWEILYQDEQAVILVESQK